MPELRITLIDVGWGDSIFLESIDSAGTSHFALIDSNDTTNLRSSEIFIKRYLQRVPRDFGPAQPLVFDWAMLSHVHADHGEGLKRLLGLFGAQRFFYPRSRHSPVYFTDLLRYARRSSSVAHHEAVDTNNLGFSFGDAQVEFLWPTPGLLPPNENNNSIVLLLTIGSASIVLTGDAEAEVWDQISGQIPPDTVFFKAPHHGSQDAMFNHAGDTPWLDNLPPGCEVSISSHIRPFNHPSQSTVDALDAVGLPYTRTDEHYHVTFTVNDSNPPHSTVKRSRI